MGGKSTDELTQILQGTHVNSLRNVLESEADEMLADPSAFAEYMRSLFQKYQIRQQDVFLLADISERYGYKLISGERRTRQRDVILRICYAAGFSLEETQKALRLYRLPELYARVPRDAALIVFFNDRPGSVLDINVLLKQAGFEMLRPCGVQE